MIESQTTGETSNHVETESRAAASSLLEHDGAVAEALAAYEAQQAAGVGAESSEIQGAHTAAALLELSDRVKELATGQAEMQELFQSRLRSDETQAKTLERLHDQVLQYKANFVRQEMQPLLRDLIYCYDYAADETDRSGKPDAVVSAQGTARAFDHLRQMIADVLAKYDVEPYRIQGDSFDRREQQCVRTTPTGAIADDKKVASAGAIGFRLGEMIVRKEQVIVYKYVPDGPASSSST